MTLEWTKSQDLKLESSMRLTALSLWRTGGEGNETWGRSWKSTKNVFAAIRGKSRAIGAWLRWLSCKKCITFRAKSASEKSEGCNRIEKRSRKLLRWRTLQSCKCVTIFSNCLVDEPKVDFDAEPALDTVSDCEAITDGAATVSKRSE